MPELLFDFSEMSRELGALDTVASRFVSANSRRVLSDLRSALDGFRSSGSDRDFQWEIPESHPFESIISDGKYDRRGGHRVFARITSVWTIRRVPHPRKPSAQPSHFRLVGKCSTVVRVMRLRGRRRERNPSFSEFAMWRQEIGDDASPGCHFHVQILGEASQPPFPKALPVPRLASVGISPASGIELVLAELFQKTWEDHVRRETPDLQTWRAIQARRLRSLFNWQQLQIGGSGSPWTNIKAAKPPEALFIPREP
jgi:hypothetical protein